MEYRQLTIDQARGLLRRNVAEDLGLDIRINESHQAPGGGTMIARNSHLTSRALHFIANRKRNTDAHINLIVYGKDEPVPEPDADLEPSPTETDKKRSQTAQRERAGKVSQQVVNDAQKVKEQTHNIQKTVSSPFFKVEDLQTRKVKQALAVFGGALKQFRRSTETAIHEYVNNGNTLIMDLITQYDLDTDSVKHALKVACFATELASMMGVDDYLGETEPEQVFEQLDEPFPDPLTDDLLEAKRQELFKKDLVEIFLGGFMHDSGLWQVSLQEGHEIRGAMLVTHTPQVETISRSLIDIVLFHSDIKNLAEHQGVVRIFGLSADREVVAFQQAYYKRAEDAHVDSDLQKEHFEHKILEEADLRAILPVAIAESYISQTQSRTPVSRHEVISQMVSYSEGGLYQKFMVALCNAQTDVIAPARTLVNLEGRVSVRQNGKARWLDVTDYVAVSVGHDNSRYAPHLIAIFYRDQDGSHKILIPLTPLDRQVWERSNPEARMYIPAGRFQPLSFAVSAVVRKDIYEKHFKPFEAEVQNRVNADRIF